MKRAVLSLLPILSIIYPMNALASVSVDISNNGKGSQSSVSVVNQQSGSSSVQGSSTNIETNIKINSNGEVKEYHYNNGEDVHVESSDGNSRVDIENDTGTTPSSSQSSGSVHTTITTEVNGVSTTTQSGNDSASESALPTLNISQIEEEKFDLISFLKKELAQIREWPVNLLRSFFG